MSSAFISSWLLRARVKAGPPARLRASCSSLDDIAMLLQACKQVDRHMQRGICTPCIGEPAAAMLLLLAPGHGQKIAKSSRRAMF
jgi:hypothetical protein